MNTAAAQKYNQAHAADVTPDSTALARLVEDWQKVHALDPDGKFGPTTRRSVMEPGVIVPPPSGPLIKLVDWIPGLFPDDVEARWSKLSSLPIVYDLGAGGRDPKNLDELKLDCTGGDCLASALDRKQENFPYYGGWINTDSIVADARGKQVLFELLDRPVRGCGLVFPSIDFDRDGDRERIGHKSWVADVPTAFDPRNPDYRLITIWDCAGSNSKLPGAVGDVMRHPAGYFNGKETFKGVTKAAWATIAVWCKATGRP